MSEKLKILVLYPHPPEPDGVSMQGHYLIKGLKELGVDVRPCDRENNIEKEWYLNTFKPDITIGIGFWADAPGLIFYPQEHGILPVPWFNADGWVANYHDALNKLPLVVATSNWVKSTYKRDGVKDNVHVCHIGFDPETFHPIPKSDHRIKKLREMLDIKEDEKMILTVGGDVTSKGAQEMFKALKLLNGKFKKWKYVLKVWDSYSADDHGKEEQKLIKELGLNHDRITYLKGKLSPEFMGILINACDIYAAPSRLEGFGMIQLEAQACGKPVISINAGGPADTIVHNKTGFLVDVSEEIKLDREWVYPWMGFDTQHQVLFAEPKTFAYRGDIDQLAEYTLKLLADDKLRETMGRAGAEHALKNFHYKVTAKHFLDLIEKFVIKK